MLPEGEETSVLGDYFDARGMTFFENGWGDDLGDVLKVRVMFWGIFIDNHKKCTFRFVHSF